ncbi:MAG: hypothetical protein E6J70_15550 [Deltaproteobacteria bacterium]|nr:MAG: hypothetical protein E6J70_15550 [Deltaproteobacteria bacterium]
MKRGARRKETGLKLGYGWIPDLPDHRDILYGAVHRVPARLPSSVDLRRGCSPVEDQGDLGSCTANALAGAVEFLEKKDRIPLVNVSRLFIYYDERVIEHTVSEDAGAMLRDGIKTLVKQGVCSEKKWPYVISKFAVKPSPACYKEGANHQVTAYARLQTVDEMRACLAEGYPFVFGFTVYESFESDQIARTGVVPMPRPTERVLGGHAVLAVGYDDAQKRFLVRNSWGSGWGLKGYFTALRGHPACGRHRVGRDGGGGDGFGPKAVRGRRRGGGGIAPRRALRLSRGAGAAGGRRRDRDDRGGRRTPVSPRSARRGARRARPGRDRHGERRDHDRQRDPELRTCRDHRERSGRKPLSHRRRGGRRPVGRGERRARLPSEPGAGRARAAGRRCLAGAAPEVHPRSTDVSRCRDGVPAGRSAGHLRPTGADQRPIRAAVPVRARGW